MSKELNSNEKRIGILSKANSSLDAAMLLSVQFAEHQYLRWVYVQ